MRIYGELDTFDSSFDQFEHDGSVMFDIEQYPDDEVIEYNIDDEEIPY